MHDDPVHQAHGRMVPYPAELERRAGDVFIHVPESSSRGPSFVGVALLIVVIAAGAGYGFGTWRTAPGQTASPEAPATGGSAARATEPAAEPAGAPVQARVQEPIRESSPSAIPAYPSMETALSPYPAVDTAYETTPSADQQSFIPPISPPPYIEFPVPPVQVLSELLYGQELVAKTLVANYGWIVEPGEIIDLQVDQVWDDPAQISRGVYVTFVAMADGRGIRASGLLRYYGDGSEGNRYMARDFMPSSVVRVGSW